MEAPLPGGVVEVSPNKRYLRFSEVLSTGMGANNVQLSYRAFDTSMGIELAWHSIRFDALSEAEQRQAATIVNLVKTIDNNNIIQYRSCWYNNETRTLNLITTHLDTLKEFVDKKVLTLRWKIVKKWSRQMLRALDFLHSHSPALVHRNINSSHIYIDGGLGATIIGDLWMSAATGAGAGAGAGADESPARSRFGGTVFLSVLFLSLSWTIGNALRDVLNAGL